MEYISNICNRQCLLQGSHFLKFVLEAARTHVGSSHFEKLSVPEKLGPTFFTTMFVSRESKTRKMTAVTGSVWRPKGEND